MIQLYAVCKKLTWDPKTQTDWKWIDEKKMLYASSNWKSTVMAILI